MAWVVLVSIVLLLAVLISGRIKPAIAFTGLAISYVVFGIVDTPHFLQNYTNPALITLLLLLLVSVALERSSFLDHLANHLLKGSERLATFKLMGSTALLSAFLNNTAVVAAFLGPISKQKRFAPSKMLIPLSYASILGGAMTLIGTSTNLVIASFAMNAEMAPLQMFQFMWVGLPVAILCIAVLLLSSRLLPNNHHEQQQDDLSYLLAAEVLSDSNMVGNSIEANKLRNLEGLYLLEIEREGRLISPVAPSEIILAGDLLLFAGDVEKVQILQRFHGLQLFNQPASELFTSNLAEVVISNQSDLPGKTLQEVDFRTMFNAGVVGIRRGEKRLRGRLGRIPLKVGDCLLLAVGSDFENHKNLDRNFHLLSGGFQLPKLTQQQSALALCGFGAVILLSALNVLPLLKGLLFLLCLLVITQILSLSEMRRRFPFEILMVIGSALTLAKGLETSGAALIIANFMQHTFNQYGVIAAFIGCYFMTLILTETVTNNAAAALAFPIAYSTAQAFGVDPLPFVMVVAYGASACFLIPFGYQTHLMVFSPGRYKIKDFLRTGLPITITYSCGVLILVPHFFSF